jgi:DNA-binding response OmpR family regulator
MSNRRNILIVDANRAAREALAGQLATFGFGVLHAGSAAEVAPLLLMRAARIDLALIETDLPDGDGRELVSRLRRRNAVLPLILLSALASEDDVVWGLDAGADDFVIRPLRVRELVARIRAQFRSADVREDGDLRIGPVVFRPTSRTLLHPDLPCAVKLTEKESALLMRLCRADGRPVSRQALLHEVWGYSPTASSHTVETHIYRLRRKIEPRPDSPCLLVSETGGYRLCLDDGPRAMPTPERIPVTWSTPMGTAQLRAVQPAA